MGGKRHRVAVIGASGYTGEELVRLLLHHPQVEVVVVTSRQHAGKALAAQVPALRGLTELRFSPADLQTVLEASPEVVFMALPHGVSAEYVGPLLEKGVVVIDLSADFRLRSAQTYEEFYGAKHAAPALLKQAVYGLPEIYRDEIRKAKLVASPGCYPTSILLGAWPAIRSGLVKTLGIIADSLSGVSGAGRKAEVDFLFVECDGSAKAYGVPKHRHLSEIEQELGLMAGESVIINFTPHMIPVNRGILTTIYFDLAKKISQAQAQSAYEKAYAKEAFVRVLNDSLPDIKNVVGTNFCEVAVRVDPRTNKLIVITSEDNLLKGAGGQAVQSMNLILGLQETTGLL